MSKSYTPLRSQGKTRPVLGAGLLKVAGRTPSSNGAGPGPSSAAAAAAGTTPAAVKLQAQATPVTGASTPSQQVTQIRPATERNGNGGESADEEIMRLKRELGMFMPGLISPPPVGPPGGDALPSSTKPGTLSRDDIGSRLQDLERLQADAAQLMQRQGGRAASAPSGGRDQMQSGTVAVVGGATRTSADGFHLKSSITNGQRTSSTSGDSKPESKSKRDTGSGQGGHVSVVHEHNMARFARLAALQQQGAQLAAALR